MKRYLVILTIIIFLSSYTEVLAIEKMEFNSGITYNNFIYQMVRNGKADEDYFMREDLHSGMGFYGEGIYWLNKKVGIGAGIDKASATWSGTNEYSDGDTRDFEYTSELVGPYGKLIYSLNNSINLSTHFIYYKYKEHFKAEYSWKDEIFSNNLKQGDGLGVALGVETNYSVSNNLSLKSSIHYRKANIKLNKEYDDVKDKTIFISEDEELNISGLRASIVLSYTL
ncbi:hypothetical protein JCM16358_05560 [Halanaerocella petrolearia]